MAHPDLLAAALVPDALEQHAVVGQIDEGAAELAMLGSRDLAAQLLAHGLHAVADAQYRHAGLEHPRGARGEAPSVRLAGPPDRMMPRGCQARDAVRIGVERPDFAIDPGLRAAAGR